MFVFVQRCRRLKPRPQAFTSLHLHLFMTGIIENNSRMSLPTSSLSDPPHIAILNDSSGFTINNSNFQAIGSQHNHYHLERKGNFFLNCLGTI